MWEGVPHALNYPTIDNFIRKGSGNLDTAWAITRMLGITLDEAFVPSNDEPISSDADTRGYKYKEFEELLKEVTAYHENNNSKNVGGVEMNKYKNEALLQRINEYTKNNSSATGEAAKRFAKKLEEQIKSTNFNSPNFNDTVISFLTIKAKELNELDEDIIVQFLEKCQHNHAQSVVERFVDICTSAQFEIELDRLTFIGQCLGETGFDEDGSRCFKPFALSRPSAAAIYRTLLSSNCRLIRPTFMPHSPKAEWMTRA
jgi:hypothetical protein